MFPRRTRSTCKGWGWAQESLHSQALTSSTNRPTCHRLSRLVNEVVYLMVIPYIGQSSIDCPNSRQGLMLAPVVVSFWTEKRVDRPRAKMRPESDLCNICLWSNRNRNDDLHHDQTVFSSHTFMRTASSIRNVSLFLRPDPTVFSSPTFMRTVFSFRIVFSLILSSEIDEATADFYADGIIGQNLHVWRVVGSRVCGLGPNRTE